MEERAPRYPIVLIHGLNCRDETPVFYWGRVPDLLRRQGARVYLSGQDAWGTIEDNARVLQGRVLSILEETHCGRVNLVVHSKGGLEARYLISSLSMAEQVASLSTISTPHRGARTAAPWCRRRRLLRLVACPYNALWRALGDRRPDFAEALTSLTPERMERFNRENPDSPLVYYQSWGAELQQCRTDPVMRFTRWFLHFHDGETDGLVSPASARWGVYRGTIPGVSHRDLVDSRRRTTEAFDPAAFYTALAAGLAELGF